MRLCQASAARVPSTCARACAPGLPLDGQSASQREGEHDMEERSEGRASCRGGNVRAFGVETLKLSGWKCASSRLRRRFIFDTQETWRKGAGGRVEAFGRGSVRGLNDLKVEGSVSSRPRWRDGQSNEDMKACAKTPLQRG
eukprot:104996-Pleurochrysis_carterae.AAC.1